MKYIKKMLLVLMAGACICLLAGYVSAQTSSENGVILTLTTDKEVYQADEAVEVTLKVTNTGETTLRSVQVKADYSKELEPGNMKFHVTNILPGKEDVYVFRIKKAGKKTEKDIGIVKQPPVTGDSTNIIRYVALAIFALIVIVVLIMHSYFKLFAFFLAAALVVGSAGTVQALPTAHTQHVSKGVKIDNVSYEIRMTVNYGIEEKKTTTQTTTKTQTSSMTETSQKESSLSTETSTEEDVTHSTETTEETTSQTEESKTETSSEEELPEGVTVVKLPINTPQNAYDVDGDGQKDSLTVEVKESNETLESFKIIINEQEAYDLATAQTDMDLAMFGDIDTYYLRFASGQSYLMLHSEGEDCFSYIFDIFRYDGQSLSSVYNVNDCCGESEMISVTMHGEPRIEESTLLLDLLIGTPSVGAFTTTLSIMENEGALSSEKEVTIDTLYESRNDGEEITVTETLRAIRDIEVYTETTDETPAFTIKSGSDVQPVRLFSEGNITYYEVTYQDQTGWMKENGETFEEVFADTAEAYDVP